MIDRSTRESLATAERELSKAAAHLRDARLSATPEVRHDPDVARAAIAVTWALEEVQRVLDADRVAA